jgi:hypothetical protein
MYTIFDKKHIKYTVQYSNNQKYSQNIQHEKSSCVQKKWCVGVWVECEGGEKRFPTLARFAEMLPVRGKGKTIIPSPQNRPTVPGLYLWIILTFSFSFYVTDNTLKVCHRCALQSAGNISAVQSLSRSGKLFHGPTTRKAKACSASPVVRVDRGCSWVCVQFLLLRVSRLGCAAQTPVFAPLFCAPLPCGDSIWDLLRCEHRAAALSQLG